MYDSQYICKFVLSIPYVGNFMISQGVPRGFLSETTMISRPESCWPTICVLYQHLCDGRENWTIQKWSKKSKK